jgi:hypothetical protein
MGEGGRWGWAPPLEPFSKSFSAVLDLAGALSRVSGPSFSCLPACLRRLLTSLKGVLSIHTHSGCVFLCTLVASVHNLSSFSLLSKRLLHDFALPPRLKPNYKSSSAAQHCPPQPKSPDSTRLAPNCQLKSSPGWNRASEQTTKADRDLTASR